MVNLIEQGVFFIRTLFFRSMGCSSIILWKKWIHLSFMFNMYTFLDCSTLFWFSLEFVTGDTSEPGLTPSLKVTFRRWRSALSTDDEEASFSLVIKLFPADISSSSWLCAVTREFFNKDFFRARTDWSYSERFNFSAASPPSSLPDVDGTSALQDLGILEDSTDSSFNFSSYSLIRSSVLLQGSQMRCLPSVSPIYGSIRRVEQQTRHSTRPLDIFQLF